MKIISFSRIEFVDLILSGEKDQTIRPAWNQSRTTIAKDIDGEYKSASRLAPELIPSGPRFKVGEKAKLMFKQRSSYYFFCKKCGKGLMPFSNINSNFCPACDQFSTSIPKDLATVEITEVFKIQLSEVDIHYLKLPQFGRPLWSRDGFDSKAEFLEFFNKKYKLLHHKNFWVYRFKLIDDKKCN